MAAKNNFDTWFVSVRLVTEKPSGHYTRRSARFANEAEAKRYAAEKVAAGIDVCAGTINPATPKRIVGPSQMLEWLAE